MKTNVLTAVRILDKDTGDSPQFVPLVKETQKHFEIGEVSADAACGSLENFETVAECGGQAYIFSSPTRPAASAALSINVKRIRPFLSEYVAKLPGPEVVRSCGCMRR